MTDFATLGMDVDSRGLVKGREELDRLTAAGAKAERGVGSLEGRSKTLSKAMRRLAVAAGGVAASLLTAFASGQSIRAAQAYETRTARINAVLEATGGIAGKTSRQLEQQAQSLARATLESVDGVRSAQQTLLTFRNVQGDVFDRAIESALDLSAAMGSDVKGATLQLAKALENPVAGMSALTESGTVFTEQQREMVKEMVAAGDTMGAQNFILGELEAQYGGVSREASAFASATDSLGQSSENLLVALGGIVTSSGLVLGAIGALDGSLQFLADNIDAVQGITITAATALTVFYTPAIYGAVTATGAWIASLVTLKGALIATGVGALVVSAGLLVGKLISLTRSTGSWAETFSLVRDVAKEVFDRIGMQFEATRQDVIAFALGVESGFKDAMASVAEAVGSGVRAVAQGVQGVIDIAISGITALVNVGINGINKLIELANKVPGIDIGTVGEFGGGSFELGGGITSAIDAVANSLRNSSDAANQAAIDTGAYADILRELAGQPLQSVQALKDVISQANSELTGPEALAGEGQGSGSGGAGADMAGAEGGAGGGGGLLGSLEKLNGLIGRVQEQDPRAAIEAWHGEAMAALNDANLIERGMMEEHNAYKLRIEQLYQDQLAELRRKEQDANLQSYQSFFGTMASAFQSGGESMLKISKAFGLAEAAVSMWRGAAKALELPFPQSLAAWAKVIATGTKALQSIKSVRPGSTGGAASGGGGGGGGAGAAQAAPPTQTVIIDAPPGMGMDQFVNMANEARKRGYLLRFETA